MARLFAVTVFVVLFNLSLAHAGYWQTVYQNNGMFYGLQENNSIFPGTYFWGPLGTGVGSHNDAYEGYVTNTSTSGTVTAVLDYIPSGLTDKAPKKIWLSETAQAGWTASEGPEGNYSGPVSVGLGGEGEVTEGLNPDGSYYKQLTKHKMTEVDASSGHIERTCSLSAEVTGAGRSYVSDDGEGDFDVSSYYGRMFTFVNFGVNIVYKGVVITSSRDTTYHREVQNGVPMAVPNFPDDYGTIYADCRGNLDTPLLGGAFWYQQRISYSGELFGPWSDGTTYQWDWQKGEQDWLTGFTSGTLGWNGFPAINLLYQAPSHGMPGDAETVHLKAKDNDGVEVDAYYHMKFHYEYENPVVLQHDYRPQPPSGHGESDMSGEWSVLTFYDESNPVPVEASATFTMGTEGSIEVGSGSEAFAKQVVAKVVVKVTKTETKTIKVTNTFGAAPAGKVYVIYWAPLTNFFNGTCEWWDDSGYQCDGNWGITDTSPLPLTWLVVRDFPSN